uniref:Retrovirus-related Pol polyprotein from transposon TNT 1-94-like beta-barrel domain-containing protein n=1 Tax=Cajanus cajan TaxID=3821 RepID=A0A151TKN0_CAJCA|nr:hypothetical protein KK1_023923 [Cajanus cajan]
MWDKIQDEFEDSNKVKSVRVFDLQIFTITELTNKLHAQKQRVFIRSDEVVEDVFRVKHNERKFGKSRIFNKNKGKVEGFSRKRNFLSYFHCQRINHSKEFKHKPLFHYNFCNKNYHSKKYCRLKKKRFEQQLENRQIHHPKCLSTNGDNCVYINPCAPSCLNDVRLCLHPSKYLSIFTSINKSIESKVKMKNAEIVQANGKRKFPISTKKGMVIVKDILCIPLLDQNVISVPQMLRNGYGISFKENYYFIMDEHGLEIAKIEMTKKSFYLKFDLVEDHDFIAKFDESNVWYGRFGHTFM